MKNHKNLFLKRWSKTQGKTRRKRNKENEDNIELFDNKKVNERRRKMGGKKQIERMPLSRLAELLNSDIEEMDEKEKKLSRYFTDCFINDLFIERGQLILELRDAYSKQVKLMNDYDKLQKELSKKNAECKMLKHRIKLLLRESKGTDCEG